MITISLQEIADTILTLAKRQGYVLSSEVRNELARAGMPGKLWREVMDLSRPHLARRHGRYYYVSPLSVRLRHEEEQHRLIYRNVRRLIRDYKARTSQTERRQHGRIHFIQPVKLVTEDQRELNVVSCDLSYTGIRLLGTSSFQGQKVRVTIPADAEGKASRCFNVHIVWSTQIGDGLFQMGGLFLEELPDQERGEGLPTIP